MSNYQQVKRMINYGDKLIFNLAGEHIGIDVASIKDIVEVERFLPLPISLPLILGIINRHGELITVAELSALIRLHSVKSEPPYRVVIIEEGNTTIDVSVGAGNMYFLWKEDIAKGDISPVSQNDYFKAIITMDDVSIRLLDCSQIIEGVEKAVRECNITLSVFSPVYH